MWFKPYTLNDLTFLNRPTIHDALGIEITELGDDFIIGTMPVDQRTHQPYGILHGGASVVLAESLGSIGAALSVDPENFIAVGLDINSNHIRSVSKGIVTGKAWPLHRGRQTQVWQIEIRNEEEKLVNVSRITMSILPKREA